MHGIEFMTNKQIMDGIDASRADGHDLQLPELADVAEHVRNDQRARALLERSHRLDRQMRTAMHQVSIPAGLAERIQRAVAAVPAVSDNLLPAAAPGVPERPAVATDEVQRHSARGWKPVAAAIALAASLLVMVGAWQLWFDVPHDPLTEENLAERSMAWDEGFATAQLPQINEEPRWDRARLQRGVRIDASYDAQSLVGVPATAHSLVAYDGSRATLFVVEEAMRAPQFPPREPSYATGGKAVAYWTTDSGLLHVLVVQDAADYSKFANPVMPQIGFIRPQGRPFLPSPHATTAAGWVCREVA